VDRDRIVQRIHAVEWYRAIEVAPGIVTPGRYDPQSLLELMGFPADLRGKPVLDNNLLHRGQAITFETLPPIRKGSPLMQFYPNDELNHDRFNWWSPTVECLRLMIESCGFREELTGAMG
jgi:hypothetical protein